MIHPTNIRQSRSPAGSADFLLLTARSAKTAQLQWWHLQPACLKLKEVNPTPYKAQKEFGFLKML